MERCFPQTPPRYALGKKCSRIYPCITPRFIPTCTIESMKGEGGGRGAQSMHTLKP